MRLKENTGSRLMELKSRILSLNMNQWLILFLIGILLVILSLPIEKMKNNNTESGSSLYKNTLSENNASGNTLYGTTIQGNIVSEGTTNGSSYNKLYSSEPSSGIQTIKNTLIGGSNTSNTSNVSEESPSEYLNTALELRLQQILSSVRGVGNVHTLIMTSEEKSDYFSSGTSRVTGILVVAEGADNPVTIQNIKEACESLFQLEPHKIKIMKMK